jgi:4-amino-4-deoxy-L-arabinose transferase-like glycosyltransferase
VQWTPLPLGHLALKVGTAALGWLAVPLTFLLGRQLYGARAGLIAAALLAISTWHIAISRVGLRFPLTAVFAVPSLFFLFRALRANRRRDWLACGALLGAGLYGYTPFRIVPPLIAVLVGLHALIDLGAWLRARASGRRGSPPPMGLTGRFWLNVLCGAAVCALVALPLLRYLYDEPATFWYRSLSRVGEGGGLQGTDIWPVLARNVANALLMFNYQGDAGWVNTVRWAPVLDGVTGALFVLGLAAVGWRILVGRDRFSLYLILSLFALLVPSILSLAFPGENPSVVRAGGAAPLAMLVAALPLAVTIERLVEEGGRGRRWLAAGGVAALIALGAWHAYAWYFVRYDAQYRASSWNSREMAAAVRAFVESGGDLRHAYHVPYPHWVDTRAIGINAGAVTWNNAVADTAALGAHAVDGAPKLYLLHPRHPEVLAELQRLYPSGRATLYRSPTEGKDFVLFLVPGTR